MESSEWLCLSEAGEIERALSSYLTTVIEFHLQRQLFQATWQMSTGYYTGLCDCCSDIETCALVWFCGCAMIPSACYWAESREEDCSICHWCAIAHPLWTRANIRAMNNMKGDRYCGDFCVYCFCFPCATCQDGRELKRIKQMKAVSQSLVGKQGNVVVRQEPPSGYAPPPPPSGGYGVPPPGYAPPPQAPPSYSAPPPPGPAPQSYGAPMAPQPGYAPPPQAPQGYQPPPPQSYGVPPEQSSGAPQPQPPQGYVPPPQAQGYVPPPQAQGYVPPPQAQGYIPPPQGYGVPPPQAPQGYGVPPPPEQKPGE